MHREVDPYLALAIRIRRRKRRTLFRRYLSVAVRTLTRKPALRKWAGRLWGVTQRVSDEYSSVIRGLRRMLRR